MIATAAPLVAALGWALLNFLWQGALIGAFAALALRVLRDARPQARYLLSCVAMLTCLLVPMTGVGLALATAWAPFQAPARVALSASAPVANSAMLAYSDSAWSSLLQPQLPWLVAAWAIGAALLALRMALGLAWVRRIGRDSADMADNFWQTRITQLATRFGLSRPVELRVSGEIDSPIAAGWWRPIVLVPAALIARLPPDLLEALLAHELAHIRRNDYLVNLVQSAIEALLFYHPVVWWLSRRIRVEREQIADDLAAQMLGEPRRLALALQALDRLQLSTPSVALAANGGQLMERIQRLIRPHGRATTWQSLTWRLALPILALAAACVTVYAQDNASPSGQSELAARTKASTPSLAAGSNAVVAVNVDAATDVITNKLITNELTNNEVASVAPVDEVAPIDRIAEIAPVAPVAPVSMPIAAVAPTPPKPPMSAPVSMPASTPRWAIHVDPEGNGDGYAIVHANDTHMAFSGNISDLPEVETLRAKIGGDLLWFRRGGKSYIVRDPAVVAQASAAWKPAEPVNAKMEALSRQMEVHSRKMEALSRRMEAASRSSDPMNADMERTSAELEAMSARQEELSLQQESLSARREALSGRVESLSRQREGARSDTEREALLAQMNQLHAQMQPLTVRMQQLGEKMRVQSQNMDAARKPMEAISREMEEASKPMEALGKQMDVLGKQQEKLSLDADRKVKALIDQAARTGQAQPAGSAAPR